MTQSASSSPMPVLRRMDRHGFVAAGQVWERGAGEARCEVEVVSVTTNRKEVLLRRLGDDWHGSTYRMAMGEFARAWTRIR